MRSILAIGIPGDRDVFELWRLLLATVCAIYAGAVTARSLWRGVLYLSTPDRQTSMIRSYVIVQLLRLRVRPLLAEIAKVAFWLAVLAAVLYCHQRFALGQP